MKCSRGHSLWNSVVSMSKATPGPIRVFSCRTVVLVVVRVPWVVLFRIGVWGSLCSFVVVMVWKLVSRVVVFIPLPLQVDSRMVVVQSLRVVVVPVRVSVPLIRVWWVLLWVVLSIALTRLLNSLSHRVVLPSLIFRVA